MSHKVQIVMKLFHLYKVVIATGWICIATKWVYIATRVQIVMKLFHLYKVVIATGWICIATKWVYIATRWVYIATGWVYIATGWVYIATGQLHDLMSDKYITLLLQVVFTQHIITFEDIGYCHIRYLYAISNVKPTY